MSCVQGTMNLVKCNLKRACDEIVMIEESQNRKISSWAISIWPIKKQNYKQSSMKRNRIIFLDYHKHYLPVRGCYALLLPHKTENGQKKVSDILGLPRIFWHHAHGFLKCWVRLP